MVKKIFALASVTALTGLMATVAASGCSSTTEITGDAPDTGTGTPVEAGKADAKKPVGDEEEPPASTECKGLTEVDLSTLTWKPPFKGAGSCTQKEANDLSDYVEKNDKAQYADWKKSVANTACQSCIFGKEKDATWKPLLENDKGELIGLNVGGCIAIASGDDKCGQSYQNWFDCRFEACGDCPDGDSAALQKCLSAASKGGCKKAYEAVTTVCGDKKVGDAETACDGTKFVFEGPIKAQCVGLTEGGE